MTEKGLITISQACEKYDLNRNTLLSWVRNNKVESFKKKVGQKAVHQLDEGSLKQHLVGRFPEKMSSDRRETTEGPPPVEVVPPLPAEIFPEEEASSNSKPPPGAMKQWKINRKDAMRRKRNHVYNVKNSMRKFSIEELSRVNAWIGRRMLEQMMANGDPNPKK